MVVGILMIAISTMYTRKYGNNLNSEFNPSNLFSQKEKNQDTKTPQKDIQSSIESIDISGIIGVRMYID